MKALRSFLGSLGGDHQMLGQLQDGVTIAQFKNIPGDLLDGIYALGYGHFQSGQLQKAHNIFLYLSFHDHTNPKYLTAFGACCTKMGMLEQAEQILTLTNEMTPNDASVAINLAYTQELMGKVEPALETLSQISTELETKEIDKAQRQSINAMSQRLKKMAETQHANNGE